LALGACGSSTSSGDEPTPERPGATPEVEQFLSQYRQAYCLAASSCCSDPTFTEPYCEEVELSDLAYALARQSKYVFHPELGAACLEDLQTVALCVDGVPASCAGVIEGLLPRGADCQSVVECAYQPQGTDTCPYKNGETRCIAPVGAGEPCGSKATGICLESSGLRCNDETGVCEPLLAAGTACEYREECASGLTCVGGVCGVGGIARDPCTYQDDCADGLFCSGGNRCNEQWALGTACTETDWYSCHAGSCENGVCRSEMEDHVCHSNWL